MQPGKTLRVRCYKCQKEVEAVVEDTVIQYQRGIRRILVLKCPACKERIRVKVPNDEHIEPNGGSS